MFKMNAPFALLDFKLSFRCLDDFELFLGTHSFEKIAPNAYRCRYGLMRVVGSPRTDIVVFFTPFAGVDLRSFLFPSSPPS